MSAFDAALAALLADPNLGSEAEWQAAAGGAWRPVRVVLSAPAAVVAGLVGPGARAGAIEATLRGADLPQPPRRGDRLRRLSPPETWRVEEAEPDPLGLSWRLSLAQSA